MSNKNPTQTISEKNIEMFSAGDNKSFNSNKHES